MTSPPSISCPRCQTRLRLRPDAPPAARLRLRCGSCGTVFVLKRAGDTTGTHAAAPSTVAPRPHAADPGSDASGSDARPTLTSPPLSAAPLSVAPSASGPASLPSTAGPHGVRVGPASVAPGSVAQPSAATLGPSQDRRRLPVFAPGAVVAERYRIVRFIARGGVGEVYEAEDLELRQHVALKTIRAEVAEEELALERFRREIQLARQVTHPNVCRIFDLGYHHSPDYAGGERITFFTMELLGGETLADRLRRAGRMTPAEALPLVRQMGEALAAAHRVGVVHRDFKGGNVVLVPGVGDEVRAVVTDFGLARGLAAGQGIAATVSRAGDIVGTPAYMAPEQLEGGAITPATDVYAFGIVIYEMLTGTLPFLADSAVATALKRLNEPPVSPREHLPDVDTVWERAILRCLARRPESRFQDVRDLLDTLAGEEVLELGADPPVPAAAPADPEPGRETEPPPPLSTPLTVAARTRPKPRLGLLAALLLLLVAVLAWRLDLLPWGRPADRSSIAIVGFADPSARTESAWLGPALAEMLATELAAGERVRVVSGETVTRARIDLGLRDTAAAGPAALQQLARNVAAEYVVVGSYGSDGSGERTIEVSLQLVGVGDGAVVARFQDSAPERELLELVSRLGASLRDELGARRLSADERGGVQRALPNAEAAPFYAEGLARLHAFDPLTARDLLEKAAAADPQSAVVRSALAAAWSSLGYGQRARDEAKRALDLAVDLPREERLAVEGRYWSIVEQPEKAAESYRALWELFPDNLDYGLRLAGAWIASGRAAEALTTVDALRRLEPPAGQDPRIDLAEAAAAAAVGDFKRQAASAARAATAGNAQGARLLVADARTAECWAQRNLGQPLVAARACQDAKRLYTEAGNLAGVAKALANLASVLYDQGDLDGAARIYEESLTTYRETGDQGGVAMALNNLAVVLRNQGDPEGARALYQESLAVSRETGNKIGAAYALSNIGGVLFEQGDLRGADEMFRGALALRREIGDRSGEAYALHNVGNVQRDLGELAAAQATHEQALAIRRAIGQRIGEVSSLASLGRVLLERGDLAAASERIAAALALARETGNKSALATSLSIEGDVLLARGDVDGARKAHADALALREELGEKGTAAESRVALAGVEVEAGRDAEAELLAQQAALHFASAATPDDEAQALVVQARATTARGRAVDALALLARARELLVGSQSRYPPLVLAVAEARALAAAGRARDAAAAIASTVTALDDTAPPGLRLDARLAAVEIATRGGAAAPGDEMEAIAVEADRLGFSLLARRARAATRS